MKICPYCTTENLEGILFCEECGEPFFGQTNVLSTTQLGNHEQANMQGRVTWGTARFDQRSSIIIRVRDHDETLNLLPKDEMLLGRSDAQAVVVPDVDMSSFGGAEQGVSRRHAIIRRGEDTLTLEDLGSTNGTHLNGQRLTPDQPRVLRDGDEVRMGRLVFHIFFK